MAAFIGNTRPRKTQGAKRPRSKKEALRNMLKANLADSERMWKDKSESHAFIVGWLQSTIKTAIDELK